LLTWLEPVFQPDREVLRRWRDQVGPPVTVQPAAAVTIPSHTLTVVTWNIAVGDGDLEHFVTDLRERIGADAPFVLLLQEAWRGGLATADALSPGAAFASRLGAMRGGRAIDVAAVARRAGLTLYYAPSMRNGSPLRSDEDRGNAILANVPLTAPTAIELPFEKQRRVAVAATVGGRFDSGEAWSLRLVSAHLDNLGGLRRLWIAGSEYARARQARALVDYLSDTDAGLLAGDFNTWFGFADRAYEETARAFPDWPPADRRATFRGLLRLDHMFFRLPEGWSATYQRADDRYGSDHYPLIATLTLPSAAVAQ
jgi:endonuclease/exonuclease/phosphatase family metal-dependent hydrolase